MLFFILSLVAAYTNRNLFFEQRISANQYRATQAIEAAEAGVEWGFAMLNGGRIDAACMRGGRSGLAGERASGSAIFRSTPTTGAVTARNDADGNPLRPACVFDGKRWQCSCPTDAAPALDAPDEGAGPFPAFRLQLTSNPAYPPGVVKLDAVGCTRLDATEICAAAAGTGDGRATVSVLVALKSALTTPPGAAATAQGRLDIGLALTVFHTDPGSGGMTLHAGEIVGIGNVTVHTVPGTPSGDSVAEDDALDALAVHDLMFANVFGMPRRTYREQPATIALDCDVVECSATRVRDLVRLNPGRMVWIEGDLDLDIADAIGSAAEPALLVVEGRVTVSDPAAE